MPAAIEAQQSYMINDLSPICRAWNTLRSNIGGLLTHAHLVQPTDTLDPRT